MNIILLSQHPPFSPLGHVSGEQIRAQHLRWALEAQGHEVSFFDPSVLPQAPENRLSFLNRQGAEALISLSIDLSAELSELTIPHVLDLYAPRIQESVFAGALSQDAILTLRAIEAADCYLVSNSRQRWYWLGILALAAVDTRQDPTRLVPLSCDTPIASKASKPPTFIAGGCHWPWQDLSQSLPLFLEALQAHPSAQLKWLGAWPDSLPKELATHPRIEQIGWLPYQEYRKLLSKATAAFDWYQPNPEREIALAFRHMDYLASGLPILGYPNTALSDIHNGAGLLSSNIAASTAEWLENPRHQSKARKAALQVAEAHHWSKTTSPLLDWLKTARKRSKTESLLHSWIAKSAAHDSAITENQVLKAQLDHVQSEIAQKRAEITTLTQNLQTQMGIIDRLSRAIDEVSGFKREAVKVLDTRIQHHTQTADALARENAILLADIEKKSAELTAMDALRERLENDLHHAHVALEQAKRRRLF